MIKINPDKDLVIKIKKSLEENDGYCPCRLFKCPDNKCICKEFREQEDGYCHCLLYYKESMNSHEQDSLS